MIPTPAGVPFTQQHAARYAAEPWLIFACGRYEGIDGRVAEEARSRMRVEEVSIGDYVLAGGEPAVLVMTEAVCRLLPGVLGNAESAADDSFGFDGGSSGGPMAGLVEGPAYTRPRVWRGREVPPVLLSGDHGAIARWRRDMRAAPDRRRTGLTSSPGCSSRRSSRRGGQALSGQDDLDDHDRDVLGRGWLSG